jgi:hypothetical protein
MGRLGLPQPRQLRYVPREVRQSTRETTCRFERIHLFVYPFISLHKHANSILCQSWVSSQLYDYFCCGLRTEARNKLTNDTLH